MIQGTSTITSPAQCKLAKISGTVPYLFCVPFYLEAISYFYLLWFLYGPRPYLQSCSDSLGL